VALFGGLAAAPREPREGAQERSQGGDPAPDMMGGIRGDKYKEYVGKKNLNKINIFQNKQ